MKILRIVYNKGVCFALMMAMLLSFAGCSRQSLKQVEQLEQRITALETENAALKGELELLREDADASSSMQQETDARRQLVLDDLPNQTALIPIPAELGGTFRFYTDLSRVLNEKYVYAYAEDGHNAVDMLLQYSVNPDDTILWSLIAYDIGGGWKFNKD